MPQVHPKFKKLSHVFANRKDGAQHRFRKEYIEQRDRVQMAWIADLSAMEQRAKSMFTHNQALARNKLEREMELAKEDARETLRLVFRRFRSEIDRIVTELGGHPQPDNMVVFPDGSSAKLPKGLYIPPEEQLRFDDEQRQAA